MKASGQKKVEAAKEQRRGFEMSWRDVQKKENVIGV